MLPPVGVARPWRTPLPGTVPRLHPRTGRVPRRSAVHLICLRVLKGKHRRQWPLSPAKLVQHVTLATPSVAAPFTSRDPAAEATPPRRSAATLALRKRSGRTRAQSVRAHCNNCGLAAVASTTREQECVHRDTIPNECMRNGSILYKAMAKAAGRPCPA